jgi:hypothetical protein
MPRPPASTPTQSVAASTSAMTTAVATPAAELFIGALLAGQGAQAFPPCREHDPEIPPEWLYVPSVHWTM